MRKAFCIRTQSARERNVAGGDRGGDRMDALVGMLAACSLAVMLGGAILFWCCVREGE